MAKHFHDDHEQESIHDIDTEHEHMSIYCVRCRETVDVDDPAPVWTRKGLPATRATCPVCGSTVFRLGKTDAHASMSKPGAIKVAGASRAELAQEAVYINFSPDDAEFARRLADDMERIGLACWLHEIEPPEVDWAGGVHPALKECTRMVLLLSLATQHEESVAKAWSYFREKNKSVIIAQLAPIDPPDPLRRRPRFDMTTDYKLAFRQMVASLYE
jgi:hypothetical protein